MLGNRSFPLRLSPSETLRDVLYGKSAQLPFLPVVAVVVDEGVLLHRCPLEACVCMAVHGPVPPLTPQQSHNQHPLTSEP